MCTRGKGIFAGQNDLTARCTITMLSFPPEKSKHGFSNCEATSLIIKIDSASNSFK
jgi:hypothetical protein